MKGQLKNIVMWVALIGTVAVLAGFASADRSEQHCWRLDIDVEHLSGLYFIDDASVREHILDLGDPIVGTRLDSLHTNEIRAALKRLPSVKEATVYTTVDGRLQVDVTQRSPLFRVWTNTNESYYVDSEGKRMPLSKQYTARVPVLTGHVSTPFAPGAASKEEEALLNEAFALFSFLEEDPFWAAQTEHIYINEEGDFVMIPRVGHCEIVLGDTSRLDAKLKRLKVFLHEISHSNNLNKYKRVNVKYRDQVVCERYF